MRYSGTSIGYQMASTLGAGFTPMIATALVIAGGGDLWLVALLWMSFSAMSLVALLYSKDRSGSDIQNLDADMGTVAHGPTAEPIRRESSAAIQS